MPSPQFVTTHSKPSALARSLVVSVFPVPAGPAGAPPKNIDRAFENKPKSKAEFELIYVRLVTKPKMNAWVHKTLNFVNTFYIVFATMR